MYIFVKNSEHAQKHVAYCHERGKLKFWCSILYWQTDIIRAKKAMLYFFLEKPKSVRLGIILRCHQTWKKNNFNDEN